MRRALYFPIAGQPRWEHHTQRQRLLSRFGGQQLKVRTADDRDVHCVWIECRDDEHGASPPGAPLDDACATPVALCLHANAMVLDDMVDWAQFYLAHGVSVMLVTFWGYPDPDEPIEPEELSPSHVGLDSPRELLIGNGESVRCPSEQTMYLDAEAALRWVNEHRAVPIDRILAHGAAPT